MSLSHEVKTSTGTAYEIVRQLLQIKVDGGSLDNPPEKITVYSADHDNSNDEGLFMRRGRFPFKATAFFWDSFRTWHSGFLRHIGFFHKRPENVNQGEHAAQLLSGLCELLKMVIDTCYYRRPLNPTWSPRIGYYCYDLFRTVRETDRLHMALHDLASEINPSFVPERGSCYICAMTRSFGSIIHSGLGDAWGHPMTWHGMASGNREGLFLVGLFRMALRRTDENVLMPLETARLSHCYELLIQLLYMTQAEVERRMTGGVSVGIQQFQREVEHVLDGAAYNANEFSLLGFGGKKIMKLRNVRDPEIMEEMMDKERVLIQQHAESITNDYSKHVEKGFIGDNSGTVNFSETETTKQEEAPKKAKAAGANPPNQENLKLIRQILEENDNGYDAMGLFSELHARAAIIPEWVQDKQQVKQYISSFITALRKELEPEKKAVQKSPYRIIPAEDA